jgi:hypothetical protein
VGYEKGRKQSVSTEHSTWKEGNETQMTPHSECRGKNTTRTDPIRKLDALQADLLHMHNNGVGRVEDVLVDGRAVLRKLRVGEAVLVHDLHLFDDRRLARLARA